MRHPQLYDGEPTRARAVLRWIGRVNGTGEPPRWLLGRIGVVEQTRDVASWSYTDWAKACGWHSGGSGDLLRKALVARGYEGFDIANAGFPRVVADPVQDRLDAIYEGRARLPDAEEHALVMMRALGPEGRENVLKALAMCPRGVEGQVGG